MIPRSQRAKKGSNSVVTFKNLLGRNYSTADKTKQNPWAKTFEEKKMMVPPNLQQSSWSHTNRWGSIPSLTPTVQQQNATDAFHFPRDVEPESLFMSEDLKVDFSDTSNLSL